MAHEIATEEVDDDETAAEEVTDDEIDEEICRICRNPGDKNNPLRYPCACNGTIKFVHEDCLLGWLCHSKTLHCEVCKHRFSFTRVYAQNAPTRLPFHEFVAGIAMRACHVLPLWFLISVSLLTKSFVTYWIWRLAFVRSFGEAQSLFLSHISTTVILTDCLLGFLLSASNAIIFNGPNLLRRFFTHLRGGAPFDELVRMQGPMFRLVVNAFIVLASNMTFVGVVIFVPFTLGRVILYQVSWPFAAADLMKGSADESSKLSNVTTLTVGYIFIVFVVFLYLGIIALIRYAKGISSIVEAVPSLLRQFLTAMRLGTRVAFVVVYMFGIVPLMFGWLLDFSTVRMFGKTMSHRVQFLSISPLASSLVHWVVGVMYVWQISKFDDLLREVLRPEVLYILHVPAIDFIVDPLHKLAREALIDVAESGSLIFIQVFLPVKLALWIAPSIFPLDISVSDPYTEIPAGMLLFQICIPLIMGHFELRTTIKSLLRCWFTRVGWALGLTDFLLPEKNIGQDNGNGEPDRVVAGIPAADDANRSPFRAENVNTGEEYEEQSDSDRYKCLLRIILLRIVASVTLLLFNLALIVVPVSMGRVLFGAIRHLPITHGIKCNDLYAFVIGSYALWTTISGAKYAIENVKSKRTSVLLNQIWKCCGIVFKSLVLLAIWLFIIPVLIGLLFELLVIVPMRVPVDESPVFLLYQDWALGLIFLKIWTRMVRMDIMLPLVGDNWRARFERVREDGFSRLQGLWVLREIVFPIVMKLLTALCVPYALAKGVFPVLGYSLVVNSTVYRFAWIGWLSVRLFCFCEKRCLVWFRNLHRSIRDDRYLVGLRLPNFGEDADTGLSLRLVD